VLHSPLAQLQWSGGDPTPLGWTATLSYLGAAAVAGAAWRSLRHHPKGGVSERRVWLGLAFLLLLLGLNKQVDFQTFLVQGGRDLSHRIGVFEFRRQIQAGFFALVVGSAGFGVWRFRRALTAFGLLHPAAVAGVAAIALFVIIRFAAIAHVEPAALVSSDDSVRFGFLEILGSGLIVYAGVKAACTVGGR
jgi:hypothetical protein